MSSEPHSIALEQYPAPPSTRAAVRPLRLLFAANFPGDVLTGIGNLTLALGKALEARSHEVDFIWKEDLPTAATAGRWSRIAFPFLLAREVGRRMRRGRHYDVVIIHEPSGMFYALAKQWNASLPPMVVSSQGIEQREWDLHAGQTVPSLKSRVLFPLTELLQANYALRHADAVACVSSDDISYLAKHMQIPADRLYRLSNGVDRSLLDVEWKPSADPQLLFVGTWLRRKGTRELVQVFSELRRTRPGLKLTVLGSSLPAAEVAREFAERDREAVEVIPQFERGSLARFLARDQIFILPSFFEGMPLSLLEAMAAGLPCVTTDICGMRDVIVHEQNGLLVAPGDIAGLSREIARLLDSAALRARLGAATRETARRLAWDKVAEEWEELFLRVARQQPRRFILQENCWSDELSQKPQERLKDVLVGLSEELQRNGDPCKEMARWAGLRMEGRILDLGCGTGWKSYCLSRTKGNFVVACDRDERLLGYGRQTFAVNRLVQSDGGALPFREGTFDWVLAIELIEHVPDPRAMLREIQRVLRPGGRLLLTTPNRLQYLRPWRPKWFYLGLRRRIVLEPSHMREYDAGELEALLPAGLCVVDLSFRGTLFGRKRPVSIAALPQPLRSWWAQGLEMVAQKAAS